MRTTITLLLIGVINVVFCAASTPLVLWHGMGDTYKMTSFQAKLKAALPGVYVHSICIGADAEEDFANSYFMHPDEQIEIACKLLRDDAKLANGFHGIGLSQGSQFLRGLIQRCPLPIRNLVTLGGQHQGVYGLPHCPGITDDACDDIRKLLNSAAYMSWIQHTVVQATYWQDPLNEQLYRQKSTFLADINNERYINVTYMGRLKQLEHFVMVRFENDSMVQPIASEWFGFYVAGQAVRTFNLTESTLFKKDRLGLKEMYQGDKIRFYSQPGDHLQLEWDWFIREIIGKYLQ